MLGSCSPADGYRLGWVPKQDAVESGGPDKAPGKNWHEYDANALGEAGMRLPQELCSAADASMLWRKRNAEQDRAAKI